MTELDDIFAHELSTIVFMWVSIIMLMIYAIAALWPLKSRHDTKTMPAEGEWMRANPSSSAPAMHP